jgi:hypothetical protein
MRPITKYSAHQEPIIQIPTTAIVEFGKESKEIPLQISQAIGIDNSVASNIFLRFTK